MTGVFNYSGANTLLGSYLYDSKTGHVMLQYIDFDKENKRPYTVSFEGKDDSSGVQIVGERDCGIL